MQLSVSRNLLPENSLSITRSPALRGFLFGDLLAIEHLRDGALLGFGQGLELFELLLNLRRGPAFASDLGVDRSYRCFLNDGDRMAVVFSFAAPVLLVNRKSRVIVRPCA